MWLLAPALLHPDVLALCLTMHSAAMSRPSNLNWHQPEAVAVPKHQALCNLIQTSQFLA